MNVGQLEERAVPGRQCGRIGVLARLVEHRVGLLRHPAPHQGRRQPVEGPCGLAAGGKAGGAAEALELVADVLP